MTPITIILPHARPVSWNTWYAGNHWSRRKLIADSVHKEVHVALYQLGYKQNTPPLPFRVNIAITNYFVKNGIDSDNIPAKFYIDGLKGILIQNDSPKFVGTVSTRSQKTDKDARIEIEITEDLDNL